LATAPATADTERDPATVVRLLPMDGAIAQYRESNETDGHERVVWENELRSLDSLGEPN